MTTKLSVSAERKLEHRAKHILSVLQHIEEASGNVTAACYYDISRPRRITHGLNATKNNDKTLTASQRKVH